MLHCVRNTRRRDRFNAVSVVHMFTYAHAHAHVQKDCFSIGYRNCELCEFILLSF